ncbi:hypothetical protein [Rhizobium sp. MHM7A]|uniref:hypothetical protein n=1 Tax=Rhizobium sp. MHM7A TaxID=2583233 RepID=UPI001105A1ED|nr:hypothetical protein [Rhizobium sp. MHM7A]TLX16602.1 hypothetical protein FFR93_04480 [Rhizobium sp. MHM7A]
MTVKLREYGENSFEVTGLLHGREIVCIDFSGGKWTIGMSRNLPLELSTAREHIAVLNDALAEVDRIEASGKTATTALISGS